MRREEEREKIISKWKEPEIQEAIFLRTRSAEFNRSSENSDMLIFCTKTLISSWLVDGSDIIW